MKHNSILFLKIVVIIIGLLVFAGLIRFPMTEGRAVNLDLISIYSDPLIIYGYIASIPFFVALYQAIVLLGYVDNNTVFSEAAVKTLGKIKFCALAIIGFVIVAILYIRFFVHGDDPAGPTMLGFIVIVISASALAIVQKLLQHVRRTQSKTSFLLQHN